MSEPIVDMNNNPLAKGDEVLIVNRGNGHCRGMDKYLNSRLVIRSFYRRSNGRLDVHVEGSGYYFDTSALKKVSGTPMILSNQLLRVRKEAL